MAGRLFPVIIVLLTILFGSGIEAQTEKIPLGNLFKKLITDQKFYFLIKYVRKFIYIFIGKISLESFPIYMKKYVTCTWE